MVTQLHSKTTRTIKIEFGQEPVTSLGGLVLAERMAERLGLWSTIGGMLPARRGRYDWLTCMKSLVMGLLGGAQGTYATQALRQDAALLKLLWLEGAPEEATVWRMLDGLGVMQEESGLLGRVQAIAARRTLDRMVRSDLLVEGFVPVFPDGTLLEGSARREGTKTLGDKGRGLLWNTVFVGPILAAQRLAAAGQGEQHCVRAMLKEVLSLVLKPLKLHKRALVVSDSLHGDQPTLRQLEEARLHYIVGANKLKKTQTTLAELSEAAWEDTGAHTSRGWSESAVCMCWLQCEEWPAKRLLMGRRWKKAGEFIWQYSGVLSSLRQRDVGPMMQRGLSLARAVWQLYDSKAGMETLYQDALSDLGLHYPPCQQHRRNSGFYAAGALALTLGMAVNVIGGQSKARGNTQRQDGGQRRRPTPKRMRLWRLRRELFTLPSRITRHARQMKVQLLGLHQATRHLFEHYWEQIARC
jgi:hypothetical protein